MRRLVAMARRGYYLGVAARLVSIPLGPNDDGRRLDRVARKVLHQVPLSRVYSAIRAGEIRLNGRRAGGDTRVAAGDVLGVREQLIRGPALSRTDAGRRSEGPEVTPPARRRDDLSQRIVVESADILVVAKERGELVHGADSLTTRVQAHLAGSLASGVSFTPGPVHRLDRNTTGLVVFSASLNGARAMSAALRARGVRKLYAAVLSGRVPGEQQWESILERDSASRRTRVHPAAERRDGADEARPPSGARESDGDRAETHGGRRPALTMVTPIAAVTHGVLVVAQIVTGRTHQIRAQAGANGTPLLGDRKYGGPPWPGGYILHAGAITLPDGLDIDAPRHMWTPLPSSAEKRVSVVFGTDAVQELYAVLSNRVIEG